MSANPPMWKDEIERARAEGCELVPEEIEGREGEDPGVHGVAKAAVERAK